MKRRSTPRATDGFAHDRDDERDEERDGAGGLDDAAIDDSAQIACPYCGAHNEITLDPSGGRVQRYVEDCQVCCQPWSVEVRYARDGSAELRVEQQ
jgi:hypothetical protein